MIDYKRYPRHDILCIDMKSFYASCECIDRDLDPLKAKLAVVGDLNRDGSVVLAASPKLKELGIKTGSRLFEIKKMKDKNIIIVQARMGFYRNISKKISGIFEEFVPPNHIHVYSVDESWLTLDGTKELWGEPKEAAMKIKEKIKKETGIVCAIGIGDNKFLSKVTLDNFAKKNGISECRYEDVKGMLHKLPIERMFGVGKQMKKRFHQMKVYTIGDLANAPINTVKKNFGIVGVNLYWNSWGIDLSPVVYDKNNPPKSVFGFDSNESQNLKSMKSVGRGVTLLEDYKEEEDIKLVMKDLIAEITEILRDKKATGRTIHLSILYSDSIEKGGFSRQKSINNFTNDDVEIFRVCEELFHRHIMPKTEVRQIQISIGNLAKENEHFDSESEEKRRKVADTMDNLNKKFGKGTVQKASTLKDKSISKERNKKIGGHFE